MTEIPAEIMQEAGQLFEKLDNLVWPDWTILAEALLAAEQRGAEREREACAKAVDEMAEVARKNVVAWRNTELHDNAKKDLRRMNNLQEAAAAIRSRGT